MPGGAVGLRAAQVRLACADASGGLVRVEVLGTVCADGGTTDAALASAIGACQHEQAWGVGGLVHGGSLCVASFE